MTTQTAESPTSAPQAPAGADTAFVTETSAQNDPTAPLWQLGTFTDKPPRSNTATRGTKDRRASTASPASSVANRSSKRASPAEEPGSGQSEAHSRFNVLQKWEGAVLDVNRSTFTGRLLDLTGSKGDQEAVIRIEEVSERDRQRIEPNAVFYWYVGYRDALSGERERASKFYFRRLPPVTETEMARARSVAAQRKLRLGW
jgi:hypothetical protein